MEVEPEWVRPIEDRESVRRLVHALGCSRVLASVLVNRGITDPAAAERALDPTAADLHPPRRLPDIETAVIRIEAAIERKENVWIFSDRDVDGIMGCTILLTLLQEFDISATPRIPGKWDGYGLSEDAVAEITDQSVDLLVAVDCGTTAHEAIGQATAAGIDVVVIDHHDPDETLPAVTACVNPRRSDTDYPNPNLAAGALAWKVGQALVETIEPLHIEAFHRQALPLAAVATIGDYMSLTFENRAIVREGYARLEDCDRPGLVQTASHCDVESMQDIGWSLVPLLNAAQEAESGELMLELLMERDAARIETLIEQLEEFRKERKEQRSERLAHLEKCFQEQVDPSTGPVLFVETEQYVGGGPMNELSERYYRPVITYRSADEGYKGGGRTAPHVDLLELYQACDDLLETYWGHPGAAGFRVAEENLTPFKRTVRETLRDRYDPESFRPTVDVDVTVEPTALSPSTVEELDRLGPFGSNHDQPIVLIENVAIAHGEWFGDESAHWKGRLAETEDVTIIDWNGETIDQDDEHPSLCDIAGTLSIDDYTDSVEVTLKALRPTDGDAN